METGDRRGGSVLLAGLALVVLAACGGASSLEETSGPAETTMLAPTPTEGDVDESTSPGDTARPPAETTTLPPRATGNDDDDDLPKGEEAERPGCGEYCRTASDYGGEGADLPAPVEVELGGEVVMYDDRTIPVRVTCTVDVDCTGAILTTNSAVTDGDGRCDLFVPAADTRLLAIPLPGPVADLVYDGESVEVAVKFDTRPTLEALGNASETAVPTPSGYAELLALDTVVTRP